MSEEKTKDLDESRSFEERVFARFDAVDENLIRLDSRVQNLEAGVQNVDARVQVLESRSYDTKPIWERALKEILEARLEWGETNRDVAFLKSDVAVLKSDVAVLKSDVAEIKRELKREVTKRLDRLLSMEHENRADIREVEDEIEELKSRLA
jgi:chromosome segregation ATPase